MFYYFILCFLVITLFLTSSSRRLFIYSDLVEKNCIFFSILISATRVDVGIDYNSYLSQIRRIAYTAGEGFGGLFTGWSFNSLISLISQFKIIGFTEEFRIIIAISSLVTILSNIFLIKTLSNEEFSKQAVGLYLLIPLFYLASFNVIRSCLSISIVYLALALFIKKKNPFLILTLFIIACTTHVIGIIFLSTILSGFILDKLIKKYPKFIYVICISTFIFILRFDFNNITYLIIENF